MEKEQLLRLKVAALREFLTCAAVKAEAIDRSGGDSGCVEMQMYTIALAVTIFDFNEHSYTGPALVESAKERARRIFMSGQDWRRELRLYDRFNQLARDSKGAEAFSDA